MGRPSSRKRSAQRSGKKERARVKNRRQQRRRISVYCAALRDCRNVDGAGHGFLKTGRKKSEEINRFLHRRLAVAQPINDGESHNRESRREDTDGRPTANKSHESRSLSASGDEV